jgi:hypothetical protein
MHKLALISEESDPKHLLNLRVNYDRTVMINKPISTILIVIIINVATLRADYA